MAARVRQSQATASGDEERRQDAAQWLRQQGLDRDGRASLWAARLPDDDLAAIEEQRARLAAARRGVADAAVAGALSRPVKYRARSISQRAPPGGEE